MAAPPARPMEHAKSINLQLARRALEGEGSKI
jgi:hypothetical protein